MAKNIEVQHELEADAAVYADRVTSAISLRSSGPRLCHMSKLRTPIPKREAGSCGFVWAWGSAGACSFRGPRSIVWRSQGTIKEGRSQWSGCYLLCYARL